MILKKCNSCIIYEPGSESDILLKARVICTDDRIKLFFDDRNGLSENAGRLRIDFTDSAAGQVKTFCELTVSQNTDPLIAEAWTADCKILEKIEVVQRQKDLRVELAEETLFSAKGRGYFSGIIQNISVGGLYMTSDTSLEEGEQFDFQYCFMAKILKVRASVLRKTVIGENNYGYGCLFVNLTNGAEKDIRQFVYRQQRKSANTFE